MVSRARVGWSATPRRFAVASMLRLNSTVMALSPLGKRRGGDRVAAIGSQIRRRIPSSSVFCRQVEFASRKSACKFNKLIRISVIRWCDWAAMRRGAFSREFATLDAMRLPSKMRASRLIPQRSCFFDVPDPRSDQDPFARLHRHHHDGSPQEGPAQCLAAGLASAAAWTEAAGRAGLYIALRAGA